MNIVDNGRFEIIAKAKEDLIKSTNIEISEDEMKVLDNFLFRCWQMGWLDRYYEKKWYCKGYCEVCGTKMISATNGWYCPNCHRTEFIK